MRRHRGIVRLRLPAAQEWLLILTLVGRTVRLPMGHVLWRQRRWDMVHVLIWWLLVSWLLIYWLLIGLIGR